MNKGSLTEGYPAKRHPELEWSHEGIDILHMGTRMSNNAVFESGALTTSVFSAQHCAQTNLGAKGQQDWIHRPQYHVDLTSVLRGRRRFEECEEGEEERGRSQ